MKHSAIFSIFFVSVILFACLSFGGIEPLPQTILIVLAILSVSIFLIRECLCGCLRLHLPFFLIPLLLFIVYCLFQFLFNVNDPFKSYLFPHTIYRYETRNLLFLIAGYFAFFYSTIHNFRDVHQIRKIVLTLGVFGLIFSIFSIIQKLSGTDSAFWTRKMPAGFFGSFFNPNNASNWLMMVFLLIFGQVINIIKKRTQSFSFKPFENRRETNGDVEILPLFILILVVIFGAIVYSGSRGSIIITIFSSGFLAIISFSKRLPRSVIAVLIIILSVIACGIIMLWMSKQPLYSDGDKVIGISQYEYRASIWHYTIKSIRHNPLFGSGLGTYRYNIQKFLPWNYPLARKNLYLNSAHNEFLELVADTGIIGAVLFISFIVFILVKMIGILFTRKSRASRSIAYSGISVIVAMGLHSLVDFNLRIPANGFLFSGICAMTYFALHYHKDGSISMKKTALMLDKWFATTTAIAVILVTLLIVYKVSSPLIAKQLDPIKEDGNSEFQNLNYGKNVSRLESAIRFDPLNGEHLFHLAKVHENEVRRIFDMPAGVVFNKSIYEKISTTFYAYFNTLACQNNDGYYHMSLGFFAMLFVDYPEMAQNIFIAPSAPFDLNNTKNTFFDIAFKHLEYAVKVDPNNIDLYRGFYMGCFYLASRAKRDGDIETAEKLISLGKQSSRKFIEIVPVYYDDEGVKRASAEQALRFFATYISTERDEMNSILPESREDLYNYTDLVIRDISSKK